MDFFAHPWYMAAGGALISSPILIHLINRMRFKRIRWAAMEFLLKSQKRNRRRLIIEQMILLLLRILLVLLAAFLVARFLYGGVGPRGAYHVVVVDDTLSMLDAGKEGAGPTTTAYNTAIEQIKEVAKNAAQAPSAQNMRIFLLSELEGSPLFEGRLSDQSVEDIDAKFAARKRMPTLLHVNPLEGLRKGRRFLSDIKSDGSNKVLHFVSDFRSSDWTGPDAEKLGAEVKAILQDGVNLNLIDVAAPYRGTTGKVALNHDNIALTDLKAETRVAIEEDDVEFTATVMNHGQGETGAFFKVYINGDESLNSDFKLDKLPPGSKTEHKFTLRFPASKKRVEITEKDNVEERERKRRLQREYVHIRATIKKDEGAGLDGLMADNVRDLVIEVRKKVPTLVVDGNKPEGRGDKGDMFHLQTFYVASSVYEVEERRLADLEKADLDLYPSIILLNVGEIPPAIIPRLKRYVENGGSLCYFMGEEVKSDHYNTALFKAGLFPLQIEDRPYDPLAAAFVDPEARKVERDRLRQTVPQPKILFRDPEKNIMVKSLAPYAALFRYLSINVYWRATPRSKWDPDGRTTDTPIVLPNSSKVDSYKKRALELTSNALRATERLAGKENEMKRFLPALEKRGREIRNALSLGELFRVAEELQKLLADPGVKNDPEKPAMTELWNHAEMKGLAAEIKEFRNEVLYGDPLVVSKMQGKGRVVAVLTPAGTIARRGVGEDAVQWNNWGAGDQVVQTTYPTFLLGLHRYLIREGQAPNRKLGEDVQYQLDDARYDPKYTLIFQPQPDLSAAQPKLETRKEQGVMEKAGNRLNFALTKRTEPGVYTIVHTLLGDGPEEDRQEKRAYAYNIDAEAESNLKRAAEEQLSPKPEKGDGKNGKLTLSAPGAAYEEFKEKQPDASESPWLYLFFIIILVVEQAMAVHLSFHLKSNETAAAGPLSHTREAPAAA